MKKRIQKGFHEYYRLFSISTNVHSKDGRRMNARDLKGTLFDHDQKRWRIERIERDCEFDDWEYENVDEKENLNFVSMIDVISHIEVYIYIYIYIYEYKEINICIYIYQLMSWTWDWPLQTRRQVTNTKCRHLVNFLMWSITSRNYRSDKSNEIRCVLYSPNRYYLVSIKNGHKYSVIFGQYPSIKYLGFGYDKGDSTSIIFEKLEK